MVAVRCKWGSRDLATSVPRFLSFTSNVANLTSILAKALFVCAMPCKTCFRKSTMCRTLAVFEPRSSRITSMRSGKSSSFICVAPTSSVSMKMASTWSIMPITSTPTSSSKPQASGFSRMARNSSFDIFPSPLSSRLSKSFFICSITQFTAKDSFSVAATALTTSQSTPINMFSTVSEERRTKIQKRTPQTGLSFPSCRTTPPKPSIRQPSISNVYIADKTELKYKFPTSVPSASCLKAIPNT
mmetsp:Transcript_73710/g.191451  ORF Transcript_73710/g.191451 Transcript_73710/m.191451 type:complete len:243 (+) Transcript_73710:915-1643(+)